MGNGMKIKRTRNEKRALPPGYISINPIEVGLNNGCKKQVIAINPSNGHIKFSHGRNDYIGNLSVASKHEIGGIIISMLQK